MEFACESLVDVVKGKLLAGFLTLFAENYLLHSLLFVCRVLAAVYCWQVIKIDLQIRSLVSALLVFLSEMGESADDAVGSTWADNGVVERIELNFLEIVGIR